MRIWRQRADVAEPEVEQAATRDRVAGSTPVQLRSAQILRVVRDGSYTRLAVHAPAIAEQARPGQFVAFAVGGPASGLLLRRSFSIARVGPAGTVEVVIAPVGPGTRWLTARVAGDRLDIVGPLGRPFPLPVAAPAGEGPRALLVGGGYGSAPLFALAGALRERGCHIAMALGAATEDKLYGTLEGRRVSDEFTFATDDGSAGVAGRVTAAFDTSLANVDVVYACGPMPMLRAVAKLAAAAGIPSYIAVEEAMACGIGVCMTCVLPVAPPKGRQAGENGDAGATAAPHAPIRMVRACTEGPVFPGDVVQFDLIGQPLPPAATPPAPTTFEAPI